jgi:hypothetical protein
LCYVDRLLCGGVGLIVIYNLYILWPPQRCTQLRLSITSQSKSGEMNCDRKRMRKRGKERKERRRDYDTLQYNTTRQATVSQPHKEEILFLSNTSVYFIFFIIGGARTYNLHGILFPKYLPLAFLPVPGKMTSKEPPTSCKCSKKNTL